MARSAGTFKPGQSGNPSGRPKIPMDVIALARTHTKDAMQRLVSIVTDDTAPPAAQVRAAEVLLDRGWGSAPATILLQGDIVQRKVIELIDHTTPQIDSK